MYQATRDFNSYHLGDIKKGQEVPLNKAWLEAGLIEIKPEMEIKPEQRRKKADK